MDCNRKETGALQKYLLIAAGGALGSIARYWVSATVSGREGTRFPWGTFVVNISACIIIGFTLTWLGRHVELNPAWRYLIPTGFIGAYSTFSTYEWETFTTMEAGEVGIALLYVVSSVAVGLAAVWIGAKLASALSA
jgi:CrcB protein